MGHGRKKGLSKARARQHRTCVTAKAPATGPRGTVSKTLSKPSLTPFCGRLNRPPSFPLSRAPSNSSSLTNKRDHTGQLSAVNANTCAGREPAVCAAKRRHQGADRHRGHHAAQRRAFQRRRTWPDRQKETVGKRLTEWPTQGGPGDKRHASSRTVAVPSGMVTSCTFLGHDAPADNQRT